MLKTIGANEMVLKKKQIYDDHNPLNRSRCDWSVLRYQNEGRDAYSKIMKPNDNDCNLFASVALDIICSVMRGEEADAFPTLEEYKTLSVTQTFRNGSISKIWFCKSYQGRQEDRTTAANVLPQDEEDRVSVIYDIPMCQDLDKKSTVKTIMEYNQRIASFILPSSNVNEEFSTSTPILKDCLIAMGRDGSPIITT